MLLSPVLKRGATIPGYHFRGTVLRLLKAQGRTHTQLPFTLHPEWLHQWKESKPSHDPWFQILNVRWGEADHIKPVSLNTPHKLRLLPHHRRNMKCSNTQLLYLGKRISVSFYRRRAHWKMEPCLSIGLSAARPHKQNQATGCFPKRPLPEPSLRPG